MSSVLECNDIEKEEKRKSRKSLLLREKARTTYDSSEDEATKSPKRKKTKTDGIPETVAEILKAFPEARTIKARIENAIKRDAAKEFIKLRAMNGGAIPGDTEKIIRIYNAFGYKFINKSSLTYQASQLVNTNAYKNILSRYGVETVTLSADSKDSADGTVSVSANKEVTTEVAKPSSSEADNTLTDTAALEDINAAKMSTVVVDQPPKKPNHGGRPIGSRTDKLSLKAPKTVKDAAQKKLILELMTKASEKYNSERQRAAAEGEKVANGTLVAIITDLETVNGLPPGTLNLESVRSRMYTGNLTGKASQRTPLLKGIETEVVDYCVKLANMSQSFPKEQIILVANQLVKKYNLEDEILEFKKRRKIIDEGDDAEQKAMIGLGWYKGFITRHMENIVKTCGHEIRNVIRHYLLHVEDFKAVYDLVYESMVNAGIAEKYAKPSLFDIVGGRVAHTEREWAYGLPSRYKMTKPEYLLFVDEVGNKIKSSRHENFYGHADGQMFNLPVDFPNTGLDTENDVIEMKFSVYCFTNGIGKVVLCAIILMSDKDVMDIPLSVRWGVDTLQPLHEGQTELELFERNCGPGQAMQGGPLCSYMGKEVNCFVGASSDGKLNSQLLLDILRDFDEIELFNRSSSLRPFLLLDGHSSYFDVDLLNYVHDAMHPWAVSCGLPRDTHLLQVADSDELNAVFKEEFNVAKQRLLDSRVHGRKQFYPSDIVPLVHHAWTISYGQHENIKRALALRGWNPLNYALLLHPMLNKRGQLSEVNKKKTAVKS